jgi:hypothetical protein
MCSARSVNGGFDMATRKRASSRSRRSGLVGRAVKAGRKALRQAESRVPPDLRRQLERTIKDGQKTLKTAIDQLQTQVRSRANQADVDKVLKRLDGLSKQVQQMARGASSRGTATARRAAGTAKRTARKPAKRKTSARGSAARKSASASAAASVAKTTPRRSPSRRRTASTPPASAAAPQPTHEPQWMPPESGDGTSG